ncbi:hypothetical protein BDW69DRAFT_176398 [Aspergillus filifer]
MYMRELQRDGSAYYCLRTCTPQEQEEFAGVLPELCRDNLLPDAEGMMGRMMHRLRLARRLSLQLLLL